MSLFSPRLLQLWTGGRWRGGEPSAITGFSIDSRKLQEGDLFVAIQTEKRDGHNYVEAAEAAGASAALVQRYVEASRIPQLIVPDAVAALQTIATTHRFTFEGPVIAITGSCGKTSTKDLLQLILGGNNVLSTSGNLNNHLGVPLTLLGLDMAQHDIAVVEAGAGSPGDIAELGGMIRPEVAIITMVGPAHLDRLGSVAGVAKEKSALGHFVHPNGFVLFPADCLQYPVFRHFEIESIALGTPDEEHEKFAAVKSAYYWTETTETTRKETASIERMNSESIETTSGIQGGCRLLLRQPPAIDVAFEVPRVSQGMMRNAAFSILAALKLGASVETIQQRLYEWKPSRHRGEIIAHDNKQFYVDCYNANPASFIDTLSAFDQSMSPDAPRLYVLGCMAELGAVAGAWHHWVGNRVRLRPGDHAIIIGDESHEFADGIVEAGNDVNLITIVESLDDIRPLVNEFEGSVLLKGSRRYRLETLLPSKPKSTGSSGITKFG